MKKFKEYISILKQGHNFIEGRNELKIENLNEHTSKVYGGIFGFCIGDILGVPVEFSSRDERDNDEVKELRGYGTYNQPFGAWSDDSSLTFCLMDAVNKGFSLEKLADNFVKFYKKGKFTPEGHVFDIGISTMSAVEKMAAGKEPLKCGGSLESDNGNGSLNRILPAAFLRKKFDNDKDFIRFIEDISSLTHGHDRAKLACIIYTVFASELIEGKEKMEAYDQTIDFVNKNCLENYKDELEVYKNILTKEIITFDREKIKSTTYVVDTLDAVFWLFFNSEGYKESVLKAVNLGGDTDTIAAITGGICGIYYGYESIPDEWIQTAIKKHKIKNMTEEFSKNIQK